MMPNAHVLLDDCKCICYSLALPEEYIVLWELRLLSQDLQCPQAVSPRRQGRAPAYKPGLWTVGGRSTWDRSRPRPPRGSWGCNGWESSSGEQHLRPNFLLPFPVRRISGPFLRRWWTCRIPRAEMESRTPKKEWSQGHLNRNGRL